MASGKLMVTEHFFPDRERASAAAAAHIAAALADRLGRGAAAALVVSGGTSPVECFRQLASASLDWSRVNILLSDERWVPPTDAASNERLVRAELLQDQAAAAQLLPIYAPAANPAERCAALDEAFASVPRPLACALLGMGADGHFASLFPDADTLQQGLDPQSAAAYVPVKTAASPHTRISMTYAALCDSDGIALLFFGADKHAVYEQAAAGDAGLPVTHLLGQTKVPVHVFWAE
jgi:6-phosphogluconolactonase